MRCQAAVRRLQAGGSSDWPRWIGLALLLTLLLSSCASNSQATYTIYVVDVSVTPRKAAQRSSKVLLVSLPQAQPGFDSRRIAYTKAPLALDYYTKSEWVDTPARMIAPLVVRTLEATGAFRAVLAAPTLVPSDLRLDIDIIRFQHEFLQQPSRMRITLRAQLLDMSTQRILATQLFEAVEIASSEDAYGGVQAANNALGRLLAEVADFVLTQITQVKA